MDLTHTIEAKSDQVDADNLLGGPRTVTITGIKAGSVEQPVQIMTDGWDVPYRPSKSMRRVLVHCWGADGSQYVGRRMTLFREPSIKYGGIVVGGTRISALSHIDKPVTVPLTVGRGKKEMYEVQPLADSAPAHLPRPLPTVDQIQQATSEDTLRAMWSAGGDQQAITARLQELRAETPDDPEPAA